jgi:ELWxxDGT repeat protein
LYFSANANDNKGTELWKFDGTTASLAADINPAGDSVPTYLTVFNNALYFSANGDSAGFELWKFDGTNATRVSDINPAGNANPAYLTFYNNELYFQANANDGTGAELWKFKGP